MAIDTFSLTLVIVVCRFDYDCVYGTTDQIGVLDLIRIRASV